jgi:hypothetical protein
MDRFTGGCLCGNVRIVAAGRPYRVGLCHCLDCRKHHGALFHASAVFPQDAVTIDGETRDYGGRLSPLRRPATASDSDCRNPPAQAQVSEHRFHCRECKQCGALTRSWNAAIINGSGYGERVAAHVAVLSREYRQSQ